jgi:hypothetical protein
MAKLATKAERKSFNAADEVRRFGHGMIEIVHVGDTDVARATFEPGWKWSTDVKPIAQTSSCQAPHLGYVISGNMHVKTDDGLELDYGPGDAMFISPGHDAWVTGNDSCVIFDVTAAPVYAKPK